MNVSEFVLYLASRIANVAFATATASVDATCWFLAYQPDIPDELKKNI